MDGDNTFKNPFGSGRGISFYGIEELPVDGGSGEPKAKKPNLGKAQEGAFGDLLANATDADLILMLAEANADFLAQATQQGGQTTSTDGKRKREDRDREDELPAAKKARLEGASDVGSQVGAEYDKFNRVGPDTNLSYQNVDYFLRHTLIDRLKRKYKAQQKSPVAQQKSPVEIEQEADRIIDKQFAITAISNQENSEIDKGLRDAILKFIAQDPPQEHITILLCTGARGAHGEIVGDGHWTTLHLRIMGNQIWVYHMNSLGKLIPPAVNRVIASIPFLIEEQLLESITIKQEDGTSKEVLGLNEANKRALAKIPTMSFGEVVPFDSAQQSNAHDCGIFAVFNANNLHNSDLQQLFNVVDKAKSKEGLKSMSEFISQSRQVLTQRFGSVVLKPEKTREELSKEMVKAAEDALRLALANYVNTVRADAIASKKPPRSEIDIVSDIFEEIRSELEQKEDERYEAESAFQEVEQNQKIQAILDSKDKPMDKILQLYTLCFEFIAGLDIEISQDPSAMQDQSEHIDNKCAKPYENLVVEILRGINTAKLEEEKGFVCSKEELEILIEDLQKSGILLHGLSNLKKEFVITKKDSDEEISTNFLTILQHFSEDQSRDDFIALYSAVHFLSQDKEKTLRIPCDISVKEVEKIVVIRGKAIPLANQGKELGQQSGGQVNLF